MFRSKFLLLSLSLCCLWLKPVSATVSMSESEMETVEKQKVETEEQKKFQKEVAVTLATYEFEASKLVDMVNEQANRASIDAQANKLVQLSEIVLDWARFRLSQCDEYIVKSLELKTLLEKISLESLESDYHHDGVLPQAPPECYHMKDMFVHPATVLVLTRDDPDLDTKTRDGINLEIVEVLAHTEVVRQLVLY